MTKKLGIGVITYNRKDLLFACIARISTFTEKPYYLLVADDGSTDGTASLCKEQVIPCITGINRGVCWNKNRALYALIAYSDCDPILLLEDDCWPMQHGWEKHWIDAAMLWHHVGFAHPAWPLNWCKGGSGTAHDPWRTAEMTGQATVTSRAALQHVGYLDTRFKGYGFGHIEWTERFCKADYVRRDSIPCITGGLALQESNSYRNREDVYRNWQRIQAVRQQPFVRVPPGTADEYDILVQEVKLGLDLPY